MKRRIRKQSFSRRRAFVLVVVTVVIALLSLAGFTFSELMFAEHEAAVLHGRALQARVLCDSGIDFVKSVLLEDEETREEGGGIYDNSARFQGALVIDDTLPAARGRTSIFAPRIEEGTFNGVRFGLENESARLNLNTILLAEAQGPDAARDLLMGLPGMTEEIADAILDWIDEDDDIREFGAEAEYYSGLVPPYEPKNGPLDTVEELLLVRGVTPWLLVGADANRNYVLDPREEPYVSATGIDNSDGSMTCGWSAYLTLYSLETNLQADGTPRINLNESDLETLYDQLKEVLGNQWATFIILMRQYGPVDVDPATTVAPTQLGDAEPNFDTPASYQFSQVLDLIGKRVQMQVPNSQTPLLIETPFPDNPISMALYMPKLMDAVTVNTSEVIPGRININQTPRTILAGIPGLEADVVDQIINERTPEVTDNEPGRRHETWLLSEGLVTLDEMKALMPMVTCGGAVYRVQVLGYTEGGGPSARVEAVIDATAEQPGVVFWRDLTHLGRGIQ